LRPFCAFSELCLLPHLAGWPTWITEFLEIGQNAGSDECERDRVDCRAASLSGDIEGAEFNERRLP
jgi:hypothetical protein